MKTVFWNAVREVRPDLYTDDHKPDRLGTTESVRALFEEAGVPDVAITEDHAEEDVIEAGSWWSIVMGSGMRSVVVQLTAEERAHVENTCRDATNEHELIRMDTIRAVAVKS
jgi:hypothetical protein